MSAAQNEVKQLRDIDDITLDFDVAQATVKSLCGLLWGLPNKGFEAETVDFNDVGRSGLAAAERMTQAFEDLQKHYDAERKGGQQS